MMEAETMDAQTKHTEWAALEVGCETNMDDGMDALQIVRDGDHSNPVAIVLPDYDVGPDDDELTADVRAFAAYIVQACNSFPALVEALRGLVAWIDANVRTGTSIEALGTARKALKAAGVTT